MPIFSSFEVVFYTLGVIVPGFLADTVLSLSRSKTVEPAQITFGRWAAFSAINYGFGSWLIYLMYQEQWFASHTGCRAFIWLVIIFVSPIVGGAIAGRFRKSSRLHSLLQWVGADPVRVIPTAWDYKFMLGTQEGAWVLVTLKNGGAVAGLYASQSFASDQTNERDIYLEQVYKYHDGQPWEPVPRSGGILIRGEEINNIEFWKIEQENTNV